MLEIYNEVIRDLLCPDSTNLKIHENIEKGVFVADMKEQMIENREQIIEALKTGSGTLCWGIAAFAVNFYLFSFLFRLVFLIINFSFICCFALFVKIVPS